jgi:hypothetical protein
VKNEIGVKGMMKWMMKNKKGAKENGSEEDDEIIKNKNERNE